MTSSVLQVTSTAKYIWYQYNSDCPSYNIRTQRGVKRQCTLAYIYEGWVDSVVKVSSAELSAYKMKWIESTQQMAGCEGQHVFAACGERLRRV